MAGTERKPPQPVPDITAHADGLPWVRFITGLVAVAMFAIPVGRRHAEEADTRPITDRVISVQSLPPAAPLPRPTLPRRDADDALPSPAAPIAPEAPSTARAQTVDAGMAPRKPQRATAAAHHVRRVAVARRRADRYRRMRRPTHVVTRAQVEREYMATRDQVAALTSQDSGSAWLMRVMARQRAARARSLVR